MKRALLSTSLPSYVGSTLLKLSALQPSAPFAESAQTDRGKFQALDQSTTVKSKAIQKRQIFNYLPNNLQNVPSYIGCFTDTAARVLNSSKSDISQYPGYNSIYYCQSIAVFNNAFYFGLENGTECYYGSSKTNLSTYGAMLGEDSCSTPCASSTQFGDPNSLGINCGGALQISIYQVQPLPAYNTYSLRNATTIGQPTYVGCFVDTPARIFSLFSDLSGYVGWDSLFYCKNQAMANNATYFGLQVTILV